MYLKAIWEWMQESFKDMIALAIALIPNSIAMMLLWNWFAVPIMKAPKLSFIQAYGITVLLIFIMMVRGSQSHKSGHEEYNDTKNDRLMSLLEASSAPIVFSVIGYFVHLWM